MKEKQALLLRIISQKCCYTKFKSLFFIADFNLPKELSKQRARAISYVILSLKPRLIKKKIRFYELFLSENNKTMTLYIIIVKSKDNCLPAAPLILSVAFLSLLVKS